MILFFMFIVHRHKTPFYYLVYCKYVCHLCCRKCRKRLTSFLNMVFCLLSDTNRSIWMANKSGGFFREREEKHYTWAKNSQAYYESRHWCDDRNFTLLDTEICWWRQCYQVSSPKDYHGGIIIICDWKAGLSNHHKSLYKNEAIWFFFRFRLKIHLLRTT